MKKFVKLFKEKNGVKVLTNYYKSHVLCLALIESLILGVSKKSLEIVRLAVNQRIVCRLRKKYVKYAIKYKKTHKIRKEKNSTRIIWFCWLQGIENAPFIVKRCLQSIKSNIKGYQVVIVTSENYKTYVQFPPIIQKKIDKGLITKTHFSDLLRLELLSKYGGTWIDSTVYCSGNNFPDYFLDSDLFVFQNLKPGLDGQATRISSWFISSAPYEPIVELTKSLLYDYWTKNNRMVDYFLIHDFFELAIETYPEEWNKVVPFENGTPHILLLRLFKKYDDYIWKSVKQQTAFHKITYKYNRDLEKKKDTYFSHIFKNENL